MVIGKQHYKDVIITDLEGGVLVIISDDEIVQHESVKVILDKEVIG